METISCKFCGAGVLYDETVGYGICEYCGSTIKKEEHIRGFSGNTEQEIDWIRKTKPYAWEHKLFFAALRLGLQTCSEMKMEYQKPLQFDAAGADMGLSQCLDWMSSRTQQLNRHIETLNYIFNSQLKVALGPPGLPGDENKLVESADSMTEVYRGILRWGLEFQGMKVPVKYQQIGRLTKVMADSLLADIEHFSREGVEKMGNLQPGMQTPTSVVLTLNSPDITMLQMEMSRLSGL